MAVFKCKMCGGSLDISNGVSVATCEYCGTKQTVSKLRDEIVSNLFNRANTLRLKCEFDKAEQVYEKILDIDNADAEAHWGIVLCKYGIEYVEDPKTYSRIPTCHRTLYEAVLTDVDYLAAIENADAEQKELYIAEAKVIDKLQKNILAIVNSEEPFDVFICYKETDEDGKRTVDSAIANDIYYQLTQEGFKVFYAPITLEDKLGHEYEPYIFAALNSAKVMLVVGTKPEYFDSVWVRNEWSRFMKLIKTDRSKMIIPCYRNMDAYELPDEFAHLQAQDMGKIGFITDVIRGLKKVFDLDIQTQPIAKKKVKKPSKIKLFIEKLNQKRKERAKYCLNFATPNLCRVFFVVSFVLSIYSIYSEPDILTDFDCYLSSIILWFGLTVPLLIFVRFIKNKITAIVLQSLGLIISICMYLTDVSSRIFEVFIIGLFAVLVQAIWLVLVCFTKKIEKSTIKKTNKILISVSAVLISVVLILVSELGAYSFLNYHYAKLLYKIGDYEAANEYFIYMDRYKDSESFANKSKLLELKNADVMDEVYLGYWYDTDGMYTDSSSSWYVLAKEDTKILLLRTYLVDSNIKPTIIGGWENSSLRKFLNEEYYNSVFNEEIKNRIIPTELKNSSDSNDITTDKIFILSKEDIEKYLPDKSQRNDVLLDTMLRDTNNGIYNVFYDDSFRQVQFINDELNIIGYDKTSRSYARYVLRTEINAIFREAKFSPAMWIDISEIE